MTPHAALTIGPTPRPLREAWSLLTIWILIQGYRIVTGRSREPLMGMVVSSLRAILIVGLATSMAAAGSELYWRLTDGLSMSVAELVTGSDDSPYEKIDQNLALMQVSMMAIDGLETGEDAGVKEDKDRAMLFTGVGVAGPAVVAAAMLLLNKIAMDETKLVWRARRYARDRMAEIDKKAAYPLKRSVREARNAALWSWWFVGLIAGIPFLVWVAKSVPQMALASLLTMYLVMLVAEVTFKDTYPRLVEAIAESQNAPRVRTLQA